MRGLGRFLLAALILSGLCGCGENAPEWLRFGRGKERAKKQRPLPAKSEGTVLASINGRVISLEYFNEYIQTLNKEIEASPELSKEMKDANLIKNKEDKQRLLDVMVERELLIDEAVARGLNRDRDVIKAVKAREDQLLFAKILDVERNKVVVTNDEIKNYYDTYKDLFIVPEERNVDVIVTSTEAKAKEILISLLQASGFAALARTHSIHKSASRGGNIGFIVRKMPFPQPDKNTAFPKLEETAFTLELNENSTIFKGPDGYYIIRVTEIRPQRQMKLEEVYNDIERGLTQKGQEDALKALIGNLRKGADIVVHERLLK